MDTRWEWGRTTGQVSSVTHRLVKDQRVVERHRTPSEGTSDTNFPFKEGGVERKDEKKEVSRLVLGWTEQIGRIE